MWFFKFLSFANTFPHTRHSQPLVENSANAVEESETAGGEHEGAEVAVKSTAPAPTGKLIECLFLWIVMTCRFKLPGFIQILLQSLQANKTLSCALLHLCLDEPDLLVELNPQGHTNMVLSCLSTIVMFLGCFDFMVVDFGFLSFEWFLPVVLNK